MILLKQLLTPLLLPLLIALAVFAGMQTLRFNAADNRATQAEASTAVMQAAITGMESSIDALDESVKRTEKTYERLATTQASLSQSLAKSQKTIEALRHENSAFKTWADTALPIAAQRLRERPAITGAEDYLRWLSSRDELPAVGNGTNGQPAPAH